jgi:PTH1 family peptidyl-tRNA hydrolase
MSTTINSKYTYIICALGNPGSSYKLTRHNVGHLFLNYMINKHKLEEISTSSYSYSIYTCNNPYKPKKEPNNKVIFLKVNEYMNVCGPLIKYCIINEFKDKTQNFKIICDDLETDLGIIKNSWVGGDRGHNGLKSVVSAFGHNNFEKLKIGIGRPDTKDPDIVAKYVLSKFNLKEINFLEESAFVKIEKYINHKC